MTKAMVIEVLEETLKTIHEHFRTEGMDVRLLSLVAVAGHDDGVRGGLHYMSMTRDESTVGHLVDASLREHCDQIGTMLDDAVVTRAKDPS